MPGTVTVACKLPHGLVLQEQTMVKRSEPVMGGGYREYEIAVRTGRAITVAGSARPVNPSEEVEFAPHAGGYGLTPGVDRDFFDRWLAQNRELDAVKKGFIFAASSDDRARGMAREGKAGLCGMEPVNPRDLPTEFRSIKTAEK
ncbi:MULTISPECIES: hypothetical protein [Methylobacterium]|uniref:Uncharacterized protein n=1 Tax=Methylobacterium jeotgali TaxID=381630 RepID=A0ABQ4T1L2_9HYPH|nr:MULTISPECIES: hypothetical protein [Methylobacterium]PIU06918.1 MAG: hypothetical protein COT56_07235 [Methylobacterium sp. CG09_land_8_20_14_0_10_71_15]PIU16130.1 MAG: hypothetical protein COT28_01555 [Methylobacterium sp. CG08_land_8_20_14_0_20_71_15]GBU18032.1 hypothetical protein AwMethylo_22470 [Methylobacterium sp.]GJE08638.1 hypothetical protein AOPFMNJM_3981 [Methylobacterium jeotgali]